MENAFYRVELDLLAPPTNLTLKLLARGARTNFGELVLLPLTDSFSQKVFGSFETRFFCAVPGAQQDTRGNTVRLQDSSLVFILFDEFRRNLGDAIGASVGFSNQT